MLKFCKEVFMTRKKYNKLYNELAYLIDNKDLAEDKLRLFGILGSIAVIAISGIVSLLFQPVAILMPLSFLLELIWLTFRIPQKLIRKRINKLYAKIRDGLDTSIEESKTISNIDTKIDELIQDNVTHKEQIIENKKLILALTKKKKIEKSMAKAQERLMRQTDRIEEIAAKAMSSENLNNDL